MTVAPPETSEQSGGGSRRSLAGWCLHRRAPLLVAALVVVSAMAYSLAWAPVVRHINGWVISNDIWSTYRTAHLVAWGDIGDIYSSGEGLVTFPGISVVLAPIAALTGALGLSESFPFSIAYPTAWLVLGPIQLILGSIVLLPLDALAEFLGVPRRRRAGLAVAGGLVLWPVLALWGHPEDVLAIAAASGTLLFAFKRQWRAAGWFFGLAVALQPLVLLILPVVVLAVVPDLRERLKFLIRAALPALCLLAIPLAQSWSATTTTLLHQPNFPTVDHPTPWLFLSPVMAAAHRGHGIAGVVFVHGHYQRIPGASVIGEVVAAGPGRTIALALACGVGLWAWKVRPGPAHVVWLAALCLALRCVFEGVMDPFYLWPPLALLLVAGACGVTWRFWSAAAASFALSVYSEEFFSPWVWYGPTMLLLATALAAARPGTLSRSPVIPVAVPDS